MMPVISTSAEIELAEVALAAVCEAPARRPASESPPNSTTRGLRSENSRATRANARASAVDSTYSAAAWTSASSVHAASRSLAQTSAWFPSETHVAMPEVALGCLVGDGDGDATRLGGDGETPGAGAPVAAKLASSRQSPRLLTRPRQLGPIRRIPCRRAVADDRCLRQRTFDSSLSEAGGEDHASPCPLLPGLLHDRLDGGHRNGDDDEIERFHDVCQGRDDLRAVEFDMMRRDRVYVATESAGEDVFEHLASDASAVATHADHRNRRWTKDARQGGSALRLARGLPPWPPTHR